MNQIKLLKTVLFSLPLFLIAGNVKAQIPDTLYYKHNTTYFWVSDELGIASPGWYGAGSINVMVNGFLYTVKASVNDGLNGNSSFFTDEYALMFGKKVTHNPFGNYMLTAGVALVNVTDKAAGSISSRVGFPVQLKYLNNAWLCGLAGFTVSAGVNINRGHSFGVLTAGIVLGKLREKVKRYRSVILNICHQKNLEIKT